MGLHLYFFMKTEMATNEKGFVICNYEVSGVREKPENWHSAKFVVIEET